MQSSSDSSPGDSGDGSAALIHRIFAQEAGAFALLVERYHDFVFQICYGILRHRQDAEDATQETFTRVAKYLDRFDPRRPFEPWLATVAGNRCRTQLAKRRSFAPLTAVSEPTSVATGQELAAELMQEEITLALARIPKRQSDAFRMFHEQSLTYAEIADALDCPVGTVKTLVHRARFGLINHLRKRGVVTATDSRGDSK